MSSAPIEPAVPFTSSTGALTAPAAAAALRASGKLAPVATKAASDVVKARWAIIRLVAYRSLPLSRLTFGASFASSEYVRADTILSPPTTTISCGWRRRSWAETTAGIEFCGTRSRGPPCFAAAGAALSASA